MKTIILYGHHAGHTVSISGSSLVIPEFPDMDAGWRYNASCETGLEAKLHEYEQRALAMKENEAIHMFYFYVPVDHPVVGGVELIQRLMELLCAKAEE